MVMESEEGREGRGNTKKGYRNKREMERGEGRKKRKQGRKNTEIWERGREKGGKKKGNTDALTYLLPFTC